MTDDRDRPPELPPGSTREAGDKAEASACDFLRAKGYRIVRKNFRAAGGEVDIVARKADLVVFVEVRYREGEEFGAPEETVGVLKRRRVVAAAKEFLRRLPPSSGLDARFDVIAVVGTGPGAVLRHYPNAFDAQGKPL